MKYWQANNFYYDFQKSITFWVWAGQDIKIFGKGTLNGNGQQWYNEFAGQEILVCSLVKMAGILLMRIGS